MTWEVLDQQWPHTNNEQILSKYQKCVWTTCSVQHGDEKKKIEIKAWPRYLEKDYTTQCNFPNYRTLR